MFAVPLLRRLRRLLGGPGSRHPGLLRAQAHRFTVAQTSVRAFYACLLYFAVVQLTTGPADSFLNRRAYAPLWPVAWLAWPPGTSGVRALLAFYGLTSGLGLLLPGSRTVRLGVFLGLLEFAALSNSFGKVGHSLHLLVLVSAALVLLPGGWTRPAALASRRLRQATLLVFWLAQGTILLSYTMSGLGKLGGALVQLAAGEPTVFSPGAFGAHIAQRLVQTSSHSTLGGWIINHPYLAWPLMPGAVAVETLAFLAAFRPALARPVATLLILFHVGTYYTMTIVFPQNCLLLALFFFVSPFEPENLDWKTVLRGVPLPGKVRAIWPSRGMGADEQNTVSRGP